MQSSLNTAHVHTCTCLQPPPVLWVSTSHSKHSCKTTSVVIHLRRTSKVHISQKRSGLVRTEETGSEVEKAGTGGKTYKIE